MSGEIIQLNTIDSTNEYMKRLYQENIIEHGSVVIATEQKNGKGQYGKTWESDKGENLLFTFFAKENTGLSKVEYNFAVSLAILNLVKKVLPKVKANIKWPNDILVNGEKIAGILIENRMRGDNVEASFVGVGLNVNQITFPRFARVGCSLRSISNQEFKVINLAKELRDLIISQMNKNRLEIKERYAKALYLFNEEGPFLHEGKQVLLSIIDVNDQGQLVTKREKGGLLKFNVGELKFLK